MTLFGYRLEKGSAPVWLRAAIPLLAVLITFILTAALLVFAQANPFVAFYGLLIEPLADPVNALEVLVKATPLLLTGLAVMFAFRGGYYKIGAEGQLYAGALAAAWVGQLPIIQSLSPIAALPLVIIAGFVAGLLWALPPALLRTRWGVD